MLTNLWWLILHIEPPWRTAGQLDFLLYATVACAVNGTAITSKQQWCLFMFCHAWHSHACNITMCHQQILWNFWLTLTSPYQATVGQVRGIWPTAVQASSLFTSKDFFSDFYWTASTWKYLAEMYVCDIARMSVGLSIYLSIYEHISSELFVKYFVHATHLLLWLGYSLEALQYFMYFLPYG